jgi:hypothetical protein
MQCSLPRSEAARMRSVKYGNRRASKARCSRVRRQRGDTATQITVRPHRVGRSVPGNGVASMEVSVRRFGDLVHPTGHRTPLQSEAVAITGAVQNESSLSQGGNFEGVRARQISPRSRGATV